MSAPADIPTDTHVYKILIDEEHAQIRRDGVFTGSSADLADGFVHLSTAAQVAGTAEKHFAGRGPLTLAACQVATMGEALTWEPSRGGALFPHLYRSLTREDIAWTAPLVRDDAGGWPIPSAPEDAG